jgi:hypothetical protein
MTEQTVGFADEVEHLKKALHLAIRNELAKFRQATGTTPSSISVQMLETTSLADPVKVFTLGPVAITFDF